jgi:hypothetical protein
MKNALINLFFFFFVCVPLPFYAMGIAKLIQAIKDANTSQRLRQPTCLWNCNFWWDEFFISLKKELPQEKH